MSRRYIWAGALLLVLASTAQAQIGISKDLVPAQGYVLNGQALTPLAKVGLERNWYTIVPLYSTERLLKISLAENMVFAQTSEANLHAYDSETGRHLWVADLGPTSLEAFPVSVNSSAVFATGSRTLYALDRTNGRTLWKKTLESMPSSGTSANEHLVSVGLNTGKLATYDIKTTNPAFFWQSGKEISGEPILAGPVVAFGSQDGRVYVALMEPPKLVFRFLTAGPISASLGTHDTRTLIVASGDHNVYSVDLFTGDNHWSFATGSPVEQQPLVTNDDVYVINTQGMLSALDANTGSPHWTLSTGGGRLLAVGEKRVYLESPFRDLYIVDRHSGKMVADARSIRERAGLNLREFTITPTNPYTGRIYLGSPTGMIVSLREMGRLKPYLLRDPNAPPFGYIPREGENRGETAAPADGTAPAPPAGDQNNPAPAGGDTPR